MQLEDGTRKYLKQENGGKQLFYFLSVIYMFAMYILPSYFGVNMPGFDLTALRIMLIIMLIAIFDSVERRRKFVRLLNNKSYTYIIFMYLFVCFYTAVARRDIKSFLNPFIDFTVFFVALFIFSSELGYKKSLDIIIGFVYVLTILGIYEYVVQKTPFEHLMTLDGRLYAGKFIRSGQYRIMSSFAHSLGYGLMLVTVVPFACVDFKEHRIDILRHIPLLALIAINIVLTGSRSTMGVFALEMVLLFLLTNKDTKKKNIFFGIFILLIFLIVLIVIRNTGIGRYMLLQITSVIDELFNTQLSLKYGAQVSYLQGSSDYRDNLPYIFTLPWLNPLIGMGIENNFSAVINGTRIRSIDNFYIEKYICYAYPGLIAIVLFYLWFLITGLKCATRSHKGDYYALLVAGVGYMINLWFVDDLGTIKYLYVIFALFISAAIEFEGEEVFQVSHKSPYSRKISKYLRYV